MTTLQQRFTALDVFRGMTICFMIIVNTPGDGATTFSPLLHAKWHGFTPTDLVFPSFLFAVGNALSFVLPKWQTLPQSLVLWKILKRTGIIFLLGFLMYWFPFMQRNAAGNITGFPFEATRVFGVLQRIALCYGIAALIIYYCRLRTAVLLGVLFLVAYWVLLYVCSDAADPLSLQGNAVLRIDKWLLGEKHLYHGEGLAFDPEGLLSTLFGIANVIAGFVVGKYIQQKGKTWETLAVLSLAGAVLVFLAYCWGLNFPINKKLWTSSFVLHTVGLDCIIIAAIIYLIDFKQKTRWTYFFEVFGRNPLFIYLLSELAATLLFFFRVDNSTLYKWIYIHFFQSAGNYLGSLLFAILFMMLCWFTGYFLDKRKVYIRV